MVLGHICSGTDTRDGAGRKKKGIQVTLAFAALDQDATMEEEKLVISLVTSLSKAAGVAKDVVNIVSVNTKKRRAGEGAEVVAEIETSEPVKVQSIVQTNVDKELQAGTHLH